MSNSDCGFCARCAATITIVRTTVGLRSTCPFCVSGGWIGSPSAARTTGVVLHSDYYDADRMSVQMRLNAFINKRHIAHQ